MYYISLAFHCTYGCSDERDENGNGEEEKEWKLLGLLYADNLVLCDGLKEDLRAVLGSFVEVCRRRGLKVNARANSWC